MSSHGIYKLLTISSRSLGPPTQQYGSEQYDEERGPRGPRRDQRAGGRGPRPRRRAYGRGRGPRGLASRAEGLAFLGEEGKV